MTDNTNFKPRRVTDPNDTKDEKSYICIRGLLVDSQAIAHEIKCHDKSSNIDGFIQLVDDEKRPVGELTVQAKTYKSKYLGQNKADVPAYFVAYASRMRNKVCVFFSVDANANKIYWKYISDDYIREFQKRGDNAIHGYQFTIDGEFVRSYKNAREAAAYGFNYRHVSQVCNGKEKTHKGFVFRFER